MQTCDDLQTEIDARVADDYRLDMIMPADAPREALLSKGGEKLRLKTSPNSEFPNRKSKAGRAGMEYRDLIPGRFRGRLIASHIRISDAGPVADYVHYHKVRFQMIFCVRGSIKVAYEDQGPPFELNAGDCILQPPMIRHRVLEATAGAEVVEIGSPAEHETWVEHDLDLPTAKINCNRVFEGQRFVRDAAADAIWMQSVGGKEERYIPIREASDGFADVRVVRLRSGMEMTFDARPTFAFILDGTASIGNQKFESSDVFFSPDKEFSLRADTAAVEFLHVSLI